MPDPARIAQAQALEIPVVVQGAKTDPATGKRELFTESATTILVFEDGALLHLQSKLAVGQAIFIHNLQNKREILSKVLETPAEGQVGHTHLEFTSPSPDFWSDGAPKPPEVAPTFLPASEAPVPEPLPEHQEENPLEMMSTSAETIPLAPVAAVPEDQSGAPREILVPAYEVIPTPANVPPVEEPIAPASEPTPEQIDAALKQLSSLPAVTPTETPDAAGHSANTPEPDHAQAEANLSALIARDARLAKYAAQKEKAAREIGRVKDSEKSHEPAKTAPAGEAATEEPVEVVKPPLWETLTSGRNATIMQIAMSVVIVVALVIIGREEWKIFFPEGVRSSAVAPKPKPSATPALKPTSAAAAPTAKASAAMPQPASSKAPEPAVARTSATPAAKLAPAPAESAATKPADVPAKAPHVVDAAPAPAPEAAPAEPRSRKASGQSAGEMIPAKILEQPQPALPDWAKSLDVDNVVKLDAVIDEKGNATVEKVLSGPRPLQHEAEQAVQLWQFEPAQLNGKPVASHMTLTVEFQPQQQ